MDEGYEAQQQNDGCGLCSGCGCLCEPDRDLCGLCEARLARRQEVEADTKPCAKCGTETRHWQRGTWKGGGGVELCNPCLGLEEQLWQVQNSCMACNRVVENEEERVHPPARVQQRDEWVSSGKVPARFLCKLCAETMNARRFGQLVRRGLHNSTPRLRRVSQLLGLGKTGLGGMGEGGGSSGSAGLAWR